MSMTVDGHTTAVHKIKTCKLKGSVRGCQPSKKIIASFYLEYEFFGSIECLT